MWKSLSKNRHVVGSTLVIFGSIVTTVAFVFNAGSNYGRRHAADAQIQIQRVAKGADGRYMVLAKLPSCDGYSFLHIVGNDEGSPTVDLECGTDGRWQPFGGVRLGGTTGSNDSANIISGNVISKTKEADGRRVDSYDFQTLDGGVHHVENYGYVPASDDIGHARVLRGYRSTDAEIRVAADDAEMLPSAAQYACVYWNETDYRMFGEDPRAEMVRVLKHRGNRLFLCRGAEGTKAIDHNDIGKKYRLDCATPTKAFR